MSEPVIFEICFPAHITRAPVCRPGETIAGVVVLKLSSPLMASHMVLKFCGMERVRRTPVSQRTETTGKRQQQQQQQLTTMSQKMVMDKEFFRREIILWGEPKVSSLRSVAPGMAHRFHFSFTMPYVNMPTPRQTADVEISYSLMASLFTEVADAQQGSGERALHDFHKTSSKCFHFEPVIQQRISHGAAVAPLESIVALKDAPALAGKTHLNLHVFHPTPAYLPGELVELLILAPAGKKIVNATFQLRENVRCRKSSAPIIDESDVPLLWKYSVDLTPPQDIVFAKLAKHSATQDIGMLGRYIFTTSDTPTVASLYRNRSGKGAGRRLLGRGDSLAISDTPNQQRASIPLSPLAETQELLGSSANSIIQTLDVSGSALATDAPAVRGRTGSLGVLHHQAAPAAQLFQQGYVPSATSVLSPTQSRPRQSQTLSTTAESILDDTRSERSSISDSLSVRYHQPGPGFGSKLLAGNFPSLNRGVASYNAAMTAAALVPKYNRLAVTPVPLGLLLAKGSYRFAKIQFTLPPITDMSPVSSVFLDFDYTVDIAMTLAGNFGSTKKVAGQLPLKIVTIRTAAKVSAPPTEGTLRDSALLSDPLVVPGSAIAASAERRGSNTDTNTDSLRDSLSCLNLSIANSDDNAGLVSMPAANRNGSPVNTLNELHFETGLPGVTNGKRLSTDTERLSLDESYPCLRSFVQNGEKVPMPELEIIHIGTATI
ncbi:hypothetical protein GGI20_002741 [Coemansia sp. BCRC 34301]|nr:hypothetical protein GGI20_002741 [Coemansia sp. BCRC 34301]